MSQDQARAWLRARSVEPAPGEPESAYVTPGGALAAARAAIDVLSSALAEQDGALDRANEEADMTSAEVGRLSEEVTALRRSDAGLRAALEAAAAELDQAEAEASLQHRGQAQPPSSPSRPISWDGQRREMRAPDAADGWELASPPGITPSDDEGSEKPGLRAAAEASAPFSDEVDERPAEPDAGSPRSPSQGQRVPPSPQRAAQAWAEVWGAAASPAADESSDVAASLDADGQRLAALAQADGRLSPRSAMAALDALQGDGGSP